MVVLGIEGRNPADAKRCFHGHVIARIGNYQINLMPGDGLAQASCIILVKAKMVFGQSLIKVADNRGPVGSRALTLVGENANGHLATEHLRNHQQA